LELKPFERISDRAAAQSVAQFAQVIVKKKNDRKCRLCNGNQKTKCTILPNPYKT